MKGTAMAGFGLDRRVTALESASPDHPAKWHWVIGKVGDTPEQARARYEAEREPILPGEGAVIWHFKSDHS